MQSVAEKLCNCTHLKSPPQNPVLAPVSALLGSEWRELCTLCVVTLGICVTFIVIVSVILVALHEL